MEQSPRQPPADPGWQEMIAAGKVGAFQLLYLPETDSTNDIALKLGLEGATNFIVLSDRQLKGRGRLGRAWQSPPGLGLYFSMAMRPGLAPEDLSKITLAAGLGVCQAIEQTCGLAPGIKWPNDLLLNGKKLGGILTETGPWQPAGRPLVVIGIGLNVNTTLSDLPEALHGRATSLAAEAGKCFPRSNMLTDVVARVEAAIARLCGGDFAGLLAEIRRRDATYGRELSWLTGGGRVVRGMALGIDDDGLLHIRDANGAIHQVLSGDITLAGQ